MQPDIAAKLRRLEALETRFQELLEAEKLEALAEFAAGAGHEINNPLAVISGRAQLFLKGETDPERRRELALVHAQAMRVHEMIADLMLFARPPEPRKANCDVAGILDAVLAELTPKAAERRVALVRTELGQPLPVEADATQLAVALRALIDNALNALAEGGRVEVSASTVDDGVQIIVRDNGPGLAPEVRRHLFDPFYSGRGAGRGLGLGLSKCWRIVTNHGGTVEVESEPGRGSTFTITLPSR